MCGGIISSMVLDIHLNMFCSQVCLIRVFDLVNFLYIWCIKEIQYFHIEKELQQLIKLKRNSMKFDVEKSCKKKKTLIFNLKNL